MYLSDKGIYFELNEIVRVVEKLILIFMQDIFMRDINMSLSYESMTKILFKRRQIIEEEKIMNIRLLECPS